MNIKQLSFFGSIILSLYASSAFSKEVHKVQDFSKTYSASVIVNDDDTYHVEVYNKKSKKLEISMVSELSDYDLELKDSNGNIKTNVHSIPYGEQSIIIYQDFNFDGKKDFAILSGYHSCYSGPSYDIYLNKVDTLVRNKSLSKIASTQCGMFNVNESSKTIFSFTKSGAYWKQGSTYKVINDEAKLIEQVETAKYPPYHNVTTYSRQNEQAKTSTHKAIDINYFEEDGILFSFRLAKSRKLVLLHKVGYNDDLSYSLVTKKKTIRGLNLVEFNFPPNFEPIKRLDFEFFELSRNEHMLVFKNPEALYQIYQIQKNNEIIKVGIKVKTGEKWYDLKGDVKTIKGRFEQLNEMENVTFKSWNIKIS